MFLSSIEGKGLTASGAAELPPADADQITLNTGQGLAACLALAASVSELPSIQNGGEPADGRQLHKEIGAGSRRTSGMRGTQAASREMWHSAAGLALLAGVKAYSATRILAESGLAGEVDPDAALAHLRTAASSYADPRRLPTKMSQLAIIEQGLEGISLAYRLPNRANASETA
jgi:hypothetical protein